jgi:hypothetical protein
MKYISRTFITLTPIIFLVLLLPETTAAQGIANVCNGPDCSSCHLVDLANRLIAWLIGLVTILFAVLMVMAGFGLVTSGGNPSALTAAKSKFTNALIGFVIVLASWLVVDTLMRGLVMNNGNIDGWGPWARVQCWNQTEMESLPEPNDANTIPSGPVTVGAVTFSAAGSSPESGEDAARQELAAAGVLDGGNVISYRGMRQVAIDGVVQMNNECNCGLTVTEVTGGSHSKSGNYRHDNGYKVDIRTRDNPELVNFVRSNFTQTASWSTGEEVFQRVTNTGLQKCAFHTTHLDCQFVPGD